MTQEEKKQPVKTIRAGAVSASIWENADPQPDGTVRMRYSVTTQKRYCDKNGNFQNSDSYFPNDLPKLQLVIQKAFEFIILNKDKKNKEAIPA